MKNKICPILTARSEAYDVECMQKECSWFSSRNCCALLMLAESAGSAADRLEDIALGDLLEDTQLTIPS